MKRVLLVATVQSHIAQFHKPLIDILHTKGYEVHVAAKNNLKEKNGLQIENADKIFDVCFSRSPLGKSNIKAYKQLKEIIKTNQYSVIHCNTPMAGVITRLIARKYRKNGIKVLYTAHGFHFYKGASIKNWLIYYPIEKICSKYTDMLITINSEDFELAKKKMNAKKTYKINGTGINIEKFQKPYKIEELRELRNELSIKKEDFVIVCIGELNKNKNQIMQIKAIEEIVEEGKNNIKLFFCGNGPLEETYNKIIKSKKLENNIFLLGYRTDISKILKIANCVVTTSIREGLGLNVLESVASGVTVIASKNRGHMEIIKNNENGYLVEQGNSHQLAEKIKFVMNKENKDIIENGLITAEKYSIDKVKKQLMEIYENI